MKWDSFVIVLQKLAAYHAGKSGTGSVICGYDVDRICVAKLASTYEVGIHNR